MINTLTKLTFYSGVIFLILLGLYFLYKLIKKENCLKILRLFINFGVFLHFCYYTFLSFALIIKPSSKIASNKEESLYNLKEWIFIEEIKIGIYGLVLISLLGVFNYFYKWKFEKQVSIKSIIKLSSINLLILLWNLVLIYFHTYNSLSVEVGYHFL